MKITIDLDLLAKELISRDVVSSDGQLEGWTNTLLVVT